MKFLVVGPGAMGCLFAARLKKAGYEVTLLDYRVDRSERIVRQGILVEGVAGEYSVQVPVVTDTRGNTYDFVLICVKSYNTEKALEAVKPSVGRESAVVTLQNGIGNVDLLTNAFGLKSVLGGVTAEGATLLGPGKIRHAGQGDTLIGPGGGPESPAGRMVAALKKAGFQARAVDNVEGLIWGKLIVNVGINALTAILGLKNGRLPEIMGAKDVMAEAVREAVSVAEAKGINLPYEDPLGRVIEVCKATAENVASMLQDVLRKKMTEVGYINGAIVREGETLGIETPVNRTLTSLVEAIQESYGERVDSLHI